MAYTEERTDQEQRDEAWQKMRVFSTALNERNYYIRKISNFCWAISKVGVWLEMHIWTLENKMQDQETRLIYRYQTAKEMIENLDKIFNAYEA